jgi:hypothetical protein
MNTVLIIPTGVGATIGGDAGDGNPVAKLIAKCSDILITHPNVVNASDINEMPENVLYVEGSLLDSFLYGNISLKLTKTLNKILVIANPPITYETINAVSAARATIGIDASILELTEPLRMIAKIENNKATGDICGLESCFNDLEGKDFDALAIHTPIEVPREVSLNYYKNGGINPWGGVEAKLSKIIAQELRKPTAHAPLENTDSKDTELYLIFQKEVVPRIAAEAISNCYLHSVLKGLHRAPRVGGSLSYKDVDLLVSPFNCWGPPHRACTINNIPIIFVKENTIKCPVKINTRNIIVENYLEAAGYIMSMRSGITSESVRAEFSKTKVIRY